jgi:cellulose synthase/poly-beta-1,6-N-acetylglucosamine synthase-like glycosyltransferase
VTLLTILVAVAATVLAFPVSIFFVECFASLFLRAGRTATRPSDISVVVMVPAHDEAAGIGATLVDVQSQLGPNDRILVVADNCNDDTAQLARSAGAEVIERLDDERRGKGYALTHGIEHLTPNPPDVLIVVDADCRLSPGSIDALVRNAVETNRPIQADYVLQPTNRSPISMISALAFLVRNRVRPRGLRRLNQPCQLDGTGMAFPWTVIRTAPGLGPSIVEDLTMGIELALLGHEPLFCIDAGVRSDLPGSRRAAMQQRRRWEHGHLATLLHQGPRLLREGVVQRRLGLIAMGADLIVPPLALLVGLLVLVLAVAIGLVFFGGSTAPLWIAGSALAIVGLGVGIGWARYGRKAVPFRYLLLVPVYLIWKVPLYLSFLVGRRERGWKRTER